MISSSVYSASFVFSVRSDFCCSTEDRVQNIDEDECAVEGDNHMECELDIVPSPFSFLNLSLQLINCVLRLLIDITRATKLGQIIIS